MLREGIENANMKIKEFKITFSDKKFCSNILTVDLFDI